MYLWAGRILKRFLCSVTAAFFIASFCFIHLHIFGSWSLKWSILWLVGRIYCIPFSRSWITCDLNLAEYERRFFFKWKYLFFLSPAFRFPQVSDEDVSIDGLSNFSSSVKLTTTRFPLMEDCWPGWLITKLCWHLIWAEFTSQVFFFTNYFRYMN